MNSPRPFAALALLLVVASTPLQAAMNLDRSIITFDPDEPGRTDVTVSNVGTDPLYVETEIIEVSAPGTSDESRTPVTPGEGMPLLVSPDKLIIQPGRKKLLRIVNLAGHSAQERVFRVNVKPVAPPATAERSGIRMFVGYQLLILIDPSEPVPNLHAVREAGRVRFENRGNVNVLLHSGRQCPQVDSENTSVDGDCSELIGTRLYPGNQWSVELPWETPAEFTVVTGKRVSRQRF